jgi:hypothetical protein
MAAPIAGMAQDAKHACAAVPKADLPEVGYGWEADIFLKPFMGDEAPKVSRRNRSSRAIYASLKRLKS